MLTYASVSPTFGTNNDLVRTIERAFRHRKRPNASVKRISYARPRKQHTWIKSVE